MTMRRVDVDSIRALQQYLLQQIRQAGSEILLAPVRIEFDAVGQSLLSELEYACVRGVKVLFLLDPDGAANIIHDHPALLSCLETSFRICCPEDSSGGAESFIIFDRQQAVAGYFDLTENMPLRPVEYRVIPVEEAVGSLAKDFERLWDRAAPYRP